MRLSDFFEKINILREGEFITLGHARSHVKGTLAYCDTIFYLKIAEQNENISCIITTKELADEENFSQGCVLSDNPRNAFYRLHNRLVENHAYPLKIEYGMGMNCHIHASAQISKRTRIGDRVTIGEYVVIKDEVIVGDGTSIDAGVVVGCEGILYMQEEGGNIFVKHAGGVRIGKDVHVLSHAIIVRSIHDNPLTTIGDHTIIGITSIIGHEAQIGRNCIISGNCMIARMAQIEEGAWIGTSSFIREYVKIGKFAKVMAGSVVIQDVCERQAVSGNFAIDHRINAMEYLNRKRKER